MTLGNTILQNGEANPLSSNYKSSGVIANGDQQSVEQLRAILKSQRETIAKCQSNNLQLNEVWYVISHRWMSKWCEYVGYKKKYEKYFAQPDHHPGPIDNSDLFNDKWELSPGLLCDTDYALVNEVCWQLLSEHYGLADGQQPIARRVILRGHSNLEVEVFPLQLNLAQLDDHDGKVERRKFSKSLTFRAVEVEARKLFNIGAETDTRLWMSGSGRDGYMETIDDCETKLDSVVNNNYWIFIEVANIDGSYTRPYASFNNASTTAANSNSSIQTPAVPGIPGPDASVGSAIPLGPPTAPTTVGVGNNFWDHSDPNAIPGLCGLANIGNTCFMSVAIQCLSNLPLLTDFMLSGAWEKDLNCDNPLGMRGEIAKAYADLIRILWSGTYASLAPRQFKSAVSEFAPQFTGYQQQDSQELLAFLLDGLHEDLNRIRKKPYVEIKEANNRPDGIVAKEAWDNYKLRNDSIIVDLFHGLLKSTLVCPECNKISVTFDPFCYLSLPLPCELEKKLIVHYMPTNASQLPIKCKVTVPLDGTIEDLCSALGQLLELPSNSAAYMTVGEVFSHKFYKLFTPTDTYKSIIDGDPIYVFALNEPITVKPERIKSLYFMDDSNGRATTYSSCFGQPQMLEFPSDRPVTYGALRKAIALKCARFADLAPDANVSFSQANGEANSEANGETNGEAIAEASGVAQSSCTIYLTKTPHFMRDCSLTISYWPVGGEDDSDCEIESDIKCIWLCFNNIKAKQQLYNEEKANEVALHSSMAERQNQNQITLHDCLQLFTNTETLDKKDAWHCPDCKKFQCATKKIDLWSVPPVLVIHLKRFSYEHRHYRNKLDEMVHFPLKQLDVRPWIIQPDHASPPIYNLIGVANHFGGLGGGHYTAYCLNPNNHKWYCYDDTRVNEANPDEVVSKAAYVLFYLRSDIPNQFATATTTGSSDNCGNSSSGNCGDNAQE